MQRPTLIRAASYASVGVALGLVALKIWGWQVTDSIAVLSSLVDSALDLLASLLTFWAVRFSLSPADLEHRFGHGKSEGLAALIQALIILGSGIYVASEGIARLLNPQPIQALGAGLAVIVVATIATLALVSFQTFVAKRTGSVAISADAMHYKADLAVNVGVGAGITLAAATGWQPIDALVGFGVAVFIISGAIDILRQALLILLDHEIPEADRSRIFATAMEHPAVLGIHDMKTRFGGNHYIIQFHAEMDASQSLLKTHEILDEIEANIRAQYRDCEIIIHPDPLGYPEPREFTE